MLVFFNLLLVSFVLAIGKNEIPLVKTQSGNYYLPLRIGGSSKPRVNFLIDFNSTQWYIDESLFPQLKTNAIHQLQVLAPKGRSFGVMNLKLLPTNISWIQYKGIIGLGLKSHFILMLQRALKKSVSIRIETLSKLFVISSRKCKNPQIGPFKISFTTWTSINYLTPLSMNFHPTRDFLALLNKTQNNFRINIDDYHSKKIDISYQDQLKSVNIKKLIDCWKVDSSQDYVCSFKTNTIADVGLALFQYPIKICKDGVDIGVLMTSTEYSYYNYFIMLVCAYVILGIVFLNRNYISKIYQTKNPYSRISQFIQSQNY